MIANEHKSLYVTSRYDGTEAPLEKKAEHRLSPNVANWPVEILKILGEDYAWVTEGVRPATIDLEKVDKETGSGFGGIVVWAAPASEPPPRSSYKVQKVPVGPTVVIPFVVRNFRLSPLDVFVSGKKVSPLTPRRVQQELMATQIFSGVDRSRKGMGDTLSDQLSPPPEAFYGQFGRPYGGGEGQKMGADKRAGAISTQDAYIINQIIPTVSPDEMKTFKDTVYRDPATLAQFVRNKTVDIVQKIVKAKTLGHDDFKNVSRWAMPKNVLLFEKKSPGRWCVTMYNDRYSAPDTIVASEAALMEQFKGVAGVNEKIWDTDGFIVTVNHDEVKPVVWHDEMMPDVTQIHSAGVWMVIAGEKHLETGFAWRGFGDYDGRVVPYVLWYDGDCFTVQEHIVGEKLEGHPWTFEEAPLKQGIWGTFLRQEEGGDKLPVTPFKIHAVYTTSQEGSWGRVIVRATDLYGHDVTFIVDEGVEKWRSAAGILSADLADGLGARAYFVPKSTPFVTLGSQRIRAAETPKEIRFAFRDTAMSNINAWRDRAHPATTLAVTCVDKDAGHYRVEGNAQENLCGQNACGCDALHAKWTLVMLGCSVADAEKIVAHACELPGKHIYVMNLRAMKEEANVKLDKLNGDILKVSQALRKNLVKESAYIRNRESVDALLSLNFVTPNNLIIYLQNLDTFKEVEEQLAKLLLMCRFGLEAVPEAAVSNALRNLNVVVESLEMLRGVVGSQMSPDGDEAADGADVTPAALSD
jgi:hypothetical protein